MGSKSDVSEKLGVPYSKEETLKALELLKRWGRIRVEVTPIRSAAQGSKGKVYPAKSRMHIQLL